MKGHIFNLLEEFIIEVSDLSTCQQILNQCSFDISEGYVNTITYPDEQLYEIVAHTVESLGISTRDAHIAFGKWIMPHLAKLVPEDMMSYSHARYFLQTLDDIHRVELKKLYPDATPPTFQYKEADARHAVLTYISTRGLFDLVEGCLEGVADYFDTPMDIARQENKTSDHAYDFHIEYKK